MKKIQAFAGLTFAALLFTFLFNACKKEQSSGMSAPPNGQQNVSFYLTDGPSNFFAHVFIDIKSVSVLVDTCSTDSTGWHNGNPDHHNGWGNVPSPASCDEWQNLDIAAGVYDVLSLRNGLDSLVAKGNIHAGTIRFIKISLGDSNSVVLPDSTVIPLHFQGWFDSTIYIPIGFGFMDEFAPGHARCWIDFDIEHSIIPFGRGFWLHPFFRCFTENATGGVEGIVLPPGAAAVITAYNSSDTATAIPWNTGQFKIQGLQQGSYSLNIISTLGGYKDTTIENINVSPGNVQNIGTVTLHQ